MRTLRTGLVAGILLLVGGVLVVLGIPEETPLQRRFIEWSQAPFVAAILVMVLHMAREWQLWGSRVFTAMFSLGLVAVIVGAAWMVLGSSETATIVLWSGVACWFVWFVVDFVVRG